MIRPGGAEGGGDARTYNENATIRLCHIIHLGLWNMNVWFSNRFFNHLHLFFFRASEGPSEGFCTAQAGPTVILLQFHVMVNKKKTEENTSPHAMHHNSN